MEWQSTKTVPYGVLAWYTVQWRGGSRSVVVRDYIPVAAVAWMPIPDEPAPFTGDPAELERDDA